MATNDPQFKTRFEPEIKDWLEAKSKSMRLSQRWLVNQAVREMMQRDQQKTA